MKPCDLEKTREIAFSALPAGQAQEALKLLDGLDGLNVQPGSRPNSIMVRYDVRDYTLEGLETALQAQGFHLDNALMQKLRRALIYYCELTQRDNLSVLPSQQKSVKPFVEAFQHHPHGDHDETPEEWRDYK